MGEEREPRLDWDEANIRHLARHQISPLEFEEALTRDSIIIDVRDEGGEDRWYVLGATSSLRVLFLVFTFRGERVRPVTGWRADKKLQELYFRMKGA